jgi:hypothetical protein
MEYYALAKDAKPDTFVDQRLRMKWTNTLNEFVTVIWYGEVDTVWGERNRVADRGAGANYLGGGGQVGADGVNVETKNALAMIKIPNSPVAVTLGIQGIGDKGLRSIFMNQDQAALKITAGFGAVDVMVAWAKWDEGNAVSTYAGDRSSEDDTDVYMVQVGVKATETVKFAVEGYWQNMNATGSDTATADLYTIGLSGDAKFGGVGVGAWVGFQTGSDTSTGTDDISQSAIMAGLEVNAKVGPAAIGGQVLYFGNDDDDEDDMSWDHASGAFENYKSGLMIFGTDIYYNNGGGGRRAYTDAAYAGYGLLAFLVKGSAKVMDGKLTVKGAAGYFMALDDKVNDEAVASREGTDLGFEIAGECILKVADAANVSLRGAYAVLGSFYDESAGGEDPDDLYKLALMVNIPY